MAASSTSSSDKWLPGDGARSHSALIAVTGATGGIGSRVLSLLAEKGVAARAIARKSVTAPATETAYAEYDDQSAMTAALRRAPTMLLVSAREHPQRLEQHRRVVAAAVAAGVEKVVYTSFLGASATATFSLARQHFHTEEAIKDAGLRFVFLRDSMYTDYLPYLAGETGAIRGPAGDGRASFVTRDDVADAATAALLTAEFDGSTFDITGPEALSFYEVADILGRISGGAVTYQPETVEEAYASRQVYGAPDWEIEGWVTSYLAIANGEMENVSDAVQRLTRHPPRGVVEFLSNEPAPHGFRGSTGQ